MLELRFTNKETTFKGYDSRVHTVAKSCLRKVYNGMNEIVITGVTLQELIENIIKPPSGVLLYEVLQMPVFENVYYSSSCMTLLLARYAHPDLPTIMNHIIMTNRKSQENAHAKEMTYDMMIDILNKCGPSVQIPCILDFTYGYRIGVSHLRNTKGVTLENLLCHVFQRCRNVLTAFAFSPELQGLLDEYLLDVLNSGKNSLPACILNGSLGKKIVQDYYTLGYTIELSDNDSGEFTVIKPEPTELPETMDVEVSDPSEMVSTADIIARISEISSQIQELKTSMTVTQNQESR